MGSAPLGGEALETALAGRTVLYSPGDPVEGRPPLYQCWGADGSLTVDRRPLFVPNQRYQTRGRWWVEGSRYCEDHGGSGAGARGAVAPNCYRVNLSADGLTVAFTSERRDMIGALLFPRHRWSGTYVEQRR